MNPQQPQMTPEMMDSYRMFVLKKYPNLPSQQLKQLDDFIDRQKATLTTQYAGQAAEAGIINPQQAIQYGGTGVLPALFNMQKQGKLQNALSADAQKTQTKVTDVENSLKVLEENLNQITERGFGPGQFGLAKNALSGGAWTPEIADYEALRKSMIGPLARAISGEVGTLTDRDISRAEGLLPKVTDTKELAQKRLDNLHELLNMKKKSKTQPGFTLDDLIEK
jgi:hypothetical protein